MNVLLDWTFDPGVVVPLALSASLFARGAGRSWSRAGVGRGVKRREAACFGAGMTALVVALVSPVDAMGEQLLSMHMVQHLLLMNVAAPLLVLGSPLQAMIRPLPLGWRRRLASAAHRRGWRATWRWMTSLWVATVLQQLALWGWHTPAAIDLALANDGIHALMHLTLLATALLFWTAVLRPRDGSYWRPLGALLTTMKLTAIGCVVFLISSHPLYHPYVSTAPAWGLTPIDDQTLGWGLMMVAGVISYLGAAVVLYRLSYARLERAYPS